MSAPLRLTPGPAAERRATVHTVWKGADRRAGDPFSQLSRRLERACQSAVQPLELAAVLESEGYTDAMVRERFGAHDIFDCAQQLYHRVPYRPADVTATTLPRIVPAERDLARGVIYLMPALWTPFTLPLVPGVEAAQATTAGLLTATLFGWGWMQGVAHRGYLALAHGPAPAAQTLLRAGIQATILTTVLCAGVGALLHLDPVTTATVGLAMALYLSSATTLLVLGQEGQMLAGLIPIAALILAQLTGLARPQPHWALLALAVGGPLILALQAIRRTGRPAATARSGEQRAWMYATYGWLCAAFLSTRILDPWASGGTLTSVVSLSWSVAPLILSMGALELTLRRAHRALISCARSHDSTPRILGRAARTLFGRAATYTAGLGAAYGLMGGAVALLGGEPAPALLGGHVLVGTALLLCGYLINVGLLGQALLIWLAALSTQVGARQLGLTPDVAYSLGALLAAAVSGWLSLWALRDARHLQ